MVQRGQDVSLGGNRERRMPVTVRWSPHVTRPWLTMLAYSLRSGRRCGGGGRREGVVGGEQGAARMGHGVVDLEACVGEADAGFL